MITWSQPWIGFTTSTASQHDHDTPELDEINMKYVNEMLPPGNYYKLKLVNKFISNKQW